MCNFFNYKIQQAGNCHSRCPAEVSKRIFPKYAKKFLLKFYQFLCRKLPKCIRSKLTFSSTGKKPILFLSGKNLTVTKLELTLAKRTFSKPRTFMKVKRVHFDQTKFLRKNVARCRKIQHFVAIVVVVFFSKKPHTKKKEKMESFLP